jgi:hypothetical protein
VSDATSLTAEQILPFAVAVQRRDRQIRSGYTLLLQTWPDCPTCGEAPTEVDVRRSEASFDHQVGLRPCQHVFTVNDHDFWQAMREAERIIAREGTDSVTAPPKQPTSPLRDHAVTLDNGAIEVVQAEGAFTDDQWLHLYVGDHETVFSAPVRRVVCMRVTPIPERTEQ